MTRHVSVEQADPAFFVEARSIHEAREAAYAFLHEINGRGPNESRRTDYDRVLNMMGECDRRTEALRVKYYPKRARLICGRDAILCSRTARSMQTVIPARPRGFEPLTSFRSGEPLRALPVEPFSGPAERRDGDISLPTDSPVCGLDQRKTGN